MDQDLCDCYGHRHAVGAALPVIHAPWHGSEESKLAS
jgi:hypothetical protein